MTDFIRIVMNNNEVQGIALVCRIDPTGQKMLKDWKGMIDFIRTVMNFNDVQGIALVCRIDPTGQQY